MAPLTFGHRFLLEFRRLGGSMRNWPGLGVAAAFGLILVSVGGWEVWRDRGEISTYKSRSISTAQPQVDESRGLAAARAAAVPAAAPIPSGPAPDVVVKIDIVQPETIVRAELSPAESSVPASRPVPTRPTITATTGQRDESSSNPGARAPISPPKASEITASPPTREVTPSLDSAAPSARPATAAPTNSSFLPSVVPPATEAASVPAPAASSTTPDPAPAAPAPAPAGPSPASSPARDQSAAVRTALGRYEAAYNRLDVAAVQSVWPSIDTRALARAFDNLTAQHVALQNCTIDVMGATARANCSGTAMWIPRIGGGERTSARMWTFNLNHAEGGWHIAQVQAR